MSRRKNAGEGYGYMFSGAFAKKSDAVKKEKKRKGSFVKAVMMKSGMRYAVMTPRTNPVKRKKKVVQPNPSELLIMGANPSPVHNPHEITLPAGSTLTIRMNPTAELATNGMLSDIGNFIHGKTYAGKLAMAGHRAAKRDRKAGKWARMSREKRRDLVIAAGVSPSVAESWAKLKFADIPEGWQSEIMTRLNPVCGAVIGGYPCSRKPGHKGPHLPQGATMRTRSRLRSAWKPRKANPSAAALREQFTGAPAEHFSIHDEANMPAGDYAQLGELLSLYVKPKIGGQVREIRFLRGERPLLVSDESARQLYFVGGNQDLSGATHAFNSWSGVGPIELGEVRRIDYKQRKEHVPDPDIDEWKHNFGEESGVLPTLLFDPRTRELVLQGGEYVVRREGIVN